MSEQEEKTNVVTRREVVVTLPVLKTPGWLEGFIGFIREQGVVGLAVGLILGLASKSVVDSFVQNIVNPIVGVILGGSNLRNKFWCLKSVGNVCTSKIGYGAFVSDLISFFILVAIVYFVVRGLKLDKLDKPKASK
ncbi:MAG TPA: MscL family protein [Patescibacteria group bacterium]|nr:MscL family protein [Patescibacteria group bacterium]